MKREECPRCGLEIAGTHRTAEDCVRYLAPRYALARRDLEALHRRYRALEERLERAKIQERLARKEAKRQNSVTARLLNLERLLGGGKGRMKRLDYEKPVGYRCNDRGTVWTQFDGGTTKPVSCSNCYSDNVSGIATLSGLPARIRAEVRYTLEQRAARLERA